MGRTRPEAGNRGRRVSYWCVVKRVWRGRWWTTMVASYVGLSIELFVSSGCGSWLLCALRASGGGGGGGGGHRVTAFCVWLLAAN